MASLTAAGVSAVPLVAFLFASPLLNPDQFVFTSLSLGWDWALARVAGALVLDASSGLLALLFPACGESGGWLRIEMASTMSPSPDSAAAEIPSARGFLRRTVAEARWVLGFSWRYFLLALILSAWVMVGFGQGQWWRGPTAVLFGMPGYFGGCGAVLLVHGLLVQGMSQGARLAFFLGGSATTMRNLAALGAITGRRGQVFFLVLTQGGAIILGLLFDLIG